MILISGISSQIVQLSQRETDIHYIIEKENIFAFFKKVSTLYSIHFLYYPVKGPAIYIIVTHQTFPTIITFYNPGQNI